MSYETEYAQFIDSKVPVSTLQETDWTFYGQCSMSYPYLHATPDPNREDYFAIPYGEDPLQRLDIHHLKSNGQKQRPVIFFIPGDMKDR